MDSSASIACNNSLESDYVFCGYVRSQSNSKEQLHAVEAKVVEQMHPRKDLLVS